MDNADLRNEMATAIAARIMDPNGWSLEARRIAERLRLDVTRIAFHQVLQQTCYSIVDEARKHGRSPEDVQSAYRA